MCRVVPGVCGLGKCQVKALGELQKDGWEVDVAQGHARQTDGRTAGAENQARKDPSEQGVL